MSDYLLENINTTIAKIAECMARDPKRAERLLGDVKRWAGELAASSQTVTSQAEADAVFEAAQAGLPEIPFGPAFIDAYRKHYIAWGQQCFAAGAQAAPQASAEAVQLLAGDHTGMRVDYSGLLMQAANALVAGQAERGLAEMLRQLQGHLTEIGLRWYAGDTGVVDEFCQLYAIADESRTALKSAPTAQAPVSDGKTRVVGEHLTGGCLNWDDGEDSAKGAGDEREPSPTAGMNIAQRILHVGGRNNAQGYVEFGSIQAVEALVRQVLRDLDWTCQDDDGAFQARYRIAGGEWSSWGHVVCGVKGHEQQLRYLPDGRQQRGGDVDERELEDEAHDRDNYLAAPTDALDAQRYRWLRDNNAWYAEPRIDETDGTVWKLTFYTPARIEDPTDDDSLDTAVDAARAALAAQSAASAEPSDEEIMDVWMVSPQGPHMRDQLLGFARALLSRYGRPAGDAQPVLYTTEFDGHLQTSTHGTQAEAETFARNVNALRRMDRGACVVVPLYRDAPVAAQKADDARDAERYRWLRERDLDVIVDGGVFAGKVPDNVVLNGIDLDSAIDAAMAGSGAHHD